MHTTFCKKITAYLMQKSFLVNFSFFTLLKYFKKLDYFCLVIQCESVLREGLSENVPLLEPLNFLRKEDISLAVLARFCSYKA